jgi:urease accessory protein
LRVQRPFHPEPDECHVYLLHPPGGVVGGDRLQVRIKAESGARCLVTTPAAGKFYRSDGRVAVAVQTLEVANDAVLEWLPQETLFFEGAQARCRTEVRLDEQARCIAWDIVGFGRPSAQAWFDHGAVTLAWSIDGGEYAQLREAPLIDASAVRAVWGLQGRPAMASLYAYPADAEQLARARDVLADVELAGCTLLDRLLVCRALGPSAESLKQLWIRVWQALRPEVIGRPACLPRIWAT